YSTAHVRVNVSGRRVQAVSLVVSWNAFWWHLAPTAQTRCVAGVSVLDARYVSGQALHCLSSSIHVLPIVGLLDQLRVECLSWKGRLDSRLNTLWQLAGLKWYWKWKSIRANISSTYMSN
ncbi:hypothetical protein PVAP13_4NG153281, partial [Panicum virgatum]